MPALAFGLTSGKAQQKIENRALKRKAVFGDDADDDEDDNAFAKITKPAVKPKKLQLKPLVDNETDDPSRNSSKSSQNPTTSDPNDSSAPTEYTNLSALRSAKLHDEQASKLDSSVYDYDAVYETFHVKPKPKTEDETSGPKYMTSLIASADVRKRDQLRAREKQLQKEREAEGDDFADKEKFVTGAYKKAQLEMREIEEEEKRKEQEENERRKKGGGMEAFNRSLLQKEEERQRLIEKATAEAKQRKERGEIEPSQPADIEEEDDVTQQLHASGIRVAINDDGEILDKRQLLGAGLNIAPKKRAEAAQPKKQQDMNRSFGLSNSFKSQEARAGQRERQSRMIERQIEEMAKKQQEAEEAETQAVEEKSKSKVSADAKMGAKERYLQRKREREEEARRKAAEG